MYLSLSAFHWLLYISLLSLVCIGNISGWKEVRELFAFYSLFAPYKDLVSHANRYQHAPAFALQQCYCCTLCTALPCAIFCLFSLLLDRLPWWGCSACKITATEAMTDCLVNSLQARWKSFPHSVKLEKNGSQAVLLLREWSSVFLPCSHSPQCKVMGKWVENSARCEPVKWSQSKFTRWTWKQFFFFFLWGLRPQAGWDQPDLHPSLSFQHPLVHPHHQSLHAINLSEEE